MKKSKKLKVGATYKLVKSADTNGEITDVKLMCKSEGSKVSGKKARKRVCGATQKKKQDITTAKIVAKPKCDSKVRIKVVVTAQSQNSAPERWQRAWKIKNNSGPSCPR